ncbi:CD109 antigen [Cyprinodon tularosa]|uniref:CD109 antigen n=1 Tax=Cyprinodon tularosa TaxID=77115 RepID=UPI0018E2352F|nr:CD109 antigen [Cyprinodon tularosa]
MKAAPDACCSQKPEAALMMDRLQLKGVFLFLVLTAAENLTEPHRPDSGWDWIQPKSEPSYLLLTPTALRTGLPTSVAVTVLGSSSVTVSAEIYQERGGVLSKNSTVVKGGTTAQLTLPAIKEAESGARSSYTLKVKGHRGSVQIFSNSTQLQVQPGGVSTFIQTDKRSYQPGQAVKIRAVSVLPDGKPCVGPADILIRDPRGNLVRQWLDEVAVLGVVSTEFQLSENPPLGEWSIIATVKGVSTEKSFSVDHYVLPKFEVVIKAPDVIHWEDNLKGFVSARYWYGKPVHGHMNITVSLHSHGNVYSHSKEGEIHGSEKFMFDAVDFPLDWEWMMMIFYEESRVYLTIQVSVTEYLTGLTYNNTATVALATERYHISFEDFPKVLRPSLNFNGRLKISSYNGDPLTAKDQEKMVKVSVMQKQKEKDDMKDMEFPLPADGVLPLNIQVLNDTQYLTIAVSLEDCYKDLFIDTSYTSPSHSYLRIHKANRPAEVGSSLRLKIESNFPLTDVHYLVTSRGQVVSAGRSSGYLTLVPEVSWAPMAKIIVYCVHLSGEVINDVIHLPIARFLQNKVSLRWSSEKLQPADDVALQVSVEEPDSLVGILVVDKATRWAGCHNDITMETHPPTWPGLRLVMPQGPGGFLGVTEKPAELTVFQDFFLSLNLPACVTRGEELVLEVVLFNYLQEDLEVAVIVAESDSFEFVFPDNEAVSMASVRHVYVEREGGATVLIPIRPQVLGNIPISVKAMSSAASDHIHTTVLVKAEGVPQTFSSSMLFHLSADQTSLSRDVRFSFPPGVVEGSERVSLTAIGDILGPSISGLDSLIQMPYGCGEQNMIHFAPNIYVLQYLIATGQVDPDLTRRATDYMIKGYEQQLSYQRADGSFSAFGEQDSSGSTWLSAFVLRCFLQARPFISMDDHVLQSAAAWVAMQQGADGRMLEPGRVIHTELQGGLDGPVSLTSYVLIALLEDDVVRARYDSQVTAARFYLEARLAQGVSSNYSLGLLTYALALAGSPASLTALNQLIGRAEIRDGVPMWSSADRSLSSSWQPRSANIEMVSYVLLSLHKLNQVPDGLSLMKWLSQQRNHLGGYGSTQDTVVALQALSTFAPLGISHHHDINIRVANRDSDSVASFHINKDNFLLLQSQQVVPEAELDLKVVAKGQGLALFQLNVFYNIRTEELMRKRRDTHEDEAFHLYVDLFDSEENHASLHVCSSLSHHLDLNETGMVLMEVGLLSGFSLRPDLIELDGALKKVETQPGKVVLYLDSVTTHETCVSIPLILEFMVAKVQEATVTIYDYYEPRRRAMKSYKSSWRSTASTCSFCGEDCSQCRANNDFDLNAAPRRHFLLSCFLPPLLLLFIIFSV